jgi:hypothetical protein
MNWRGWLVLGLIILVAIGGVGYYFADQAFEANRFKSLEGEIESAVRGKFDVTDIEVTQGNGNDILWFWIYGKEGQANALTDREFEAVDKLFMATAREVNGAYTVWVWIRQDNAGIWRSVVVTACETQSLLASKESQVPAQCESQQIYEFVDERHLRWLNE